MADKDYNVKLQVQIGDSVTNIDRLLEKVSTLKSAVADLGEQEMALNVVIRNTGFQNAIANINKNLVKLADESGKTGQKMGEGLLDGVDKAADKMKKKNPYKAVAKEIAEEMKTQIEGTLKGLTDSLGDVGKKIRETLNKSFEGFSADHLEEMVAGAVSKGMLKATQRFSSVGMNNFNEQTDRFKKITDDIDYYNDEVQSIGDNISKYLDTLKNLMSKLTTNAIDVIKVVAKEQARAEVETKWSENHISKKDRLAAEAEQRRLDIEQQRADNEKTIAGIAAVTQQLQNERAERKAINDEAREEKRLQSELAREERKASADIAKSNAQELVAKREAEKLERDAMAEEERRARVKARSAKQMQLIQSAAARESERNKLYETELEKSIYNYEVARNRILSQMQSTIDGARVSESAIANAAKQQRDAQLQIAQSVEKQVLGYDKIKDKMEASIESTRKLATNLQRASSAISSVGGIFSTIRSVSTSLAGLIKNAGSTFLGYARQAANTLKESALDQYESLQTAQIGFTNFFGHNAAKDLISQIREQAMKAPGVDAGQLADYVKQIAPVSNHNAQLALDAAMGMIKTVQYGGAEASQEMEYVIKNIRDVIAKGTATAIDLRQFNRAMPILEEVLASIGASDFIKNGTLKIDKTNAKELLNAFADINNNPDSPVRNIFEQMEHTLSGITDIIKQTFVTRFNETLEGLGFYDKVQSLLERFYNSGAIEKFYNFLATTANNILKFVETINWDNITEGFSQGFKAIWQAFKDVAGMLAETAGDMDLGSIIKKLLTMVGNFIKGFGSGINQILQVVAWADKNLGPDVLNRAAELLGAIASPLGKLLQAGFSLAQNVANLGSRLLYIKAESTRTKMNGILGTLEEKAKAAAYDEAAQGIAKNPVLVDLLQGSGTITNKNASVVNRNVAMYNKDLGTLAKLNADGSWTTHGGLQNLSKQELNALLKENGLPSTTMSNATAFLKKATTKIKEFGTKAIKSMAMYSVGAALSEVAGEVAAMATGNSDAKGITTALGKSLSAAVAVGSQFGILGGAIAALVSASKSLYDEWKKLKDLQEDYAKTLYSQLSNSVGAELKTSIMAQLSEAGLYEARNQADEDAKTAMYKFIEQKLKEGATPDQIMQGARDTYINKRAETHAKEKYNQWAEGFEGAGSYTSLNADEQYDRVKAIYDKLVKLGFINPTDLTKYDADGKLVDYSGSEIMNYLATQGWRVNSIEGADALTAELDERLRQMEIEKNIDFKFKAIIVGNGEEGSAKEYENFDELFKDQGWFQYNGIWTNKASLQVYLEATGKNAQDILNIIKHAQNNAPLVVREEIETENGKVSILSPNSVTILNERGKLNESNGGFIKPIYRAGGGDIRGVDTVPAMLQPGEFVMRRSAVSKLGTGVLNALNFGDLGKAAQLLGAKVSNSWNNARSYVQNANRTYKTVNNRIIVNNKTNSGRVSSYNNLVNRIAAGV